MPEIRIDHVYTTELVEWVQTEIVRFEYKGTLFAVPRELLGNHTETIVDIPQEN